MIYLPSSAPIENIIHKMDDKADAGRSRRGESAESVNECGLPPVAPADGSSDPPSAARRRKPRMSLANFRQPSGVESFRQPSGLANFRQPSFRARGGSLVSRRRSSRSSPSSSTADSRPQRRPRQGNGELRTSITIPEVGTLDYHEMFLTSPSLTEIKDVFGFGMEDGPDFCAKTNDDGKLLLHCIGLNSDLILLSTGGTAAAIARVDHFILRKLLPAYPTAAIEEDKNGRIPFTQVVLDWIQSRRSLRAWNDVAEAKRKQRESLKKVAKCLIRKLSIRPSSEDGRDDDSSVAPEDILDEGSDDGAPETIGGTKLDDFPPMVEWSLRMLSSIIDQSAVGQLGGVGSNMRFNGEASKMNISLDSIQSSEAMMATGENESLSESSASTSKKHYRPSLANIDHGVGSVFDEIIVEKVATIPHLIEELLLIQDKSARKRVFNLSVVHKVMFCSESFGDGTWLSDMLKEGIDAGNVEVEVTNENVRGRERAEGAVYYLECLQSLNIQDDLQVTHHVQRQKWATGESLLVNTVSTTDVEHFQSKRDNLYDRVGSTEGLVRTICVLEADLMARASNTRVVQRLLDKKIFSPFSLSVAVFDGIAHLVMVISFRLGPAPALFHMPANDPNFRAHLYLLGNLVLMACITWFATKEVQVLLARFALSPRLFWSSIGSFWTFLDVVPVFMAALSALAVDYAIRQRVDDTNDASHTPFALRVMVALTTPLLWLRILAHVKMFNKALATFILCSVEILKDIKWFMVVLAVAIASFAQMFVSLTYEPSASGISHDEGEGHYAYVSLEGYLKAYTIMLGDLDADSLKSHPIIILIFVFYTFGVTIVLLNILIAIVSESYANAAVSSKLLLGEARVMFVAELLSLNLFHRLWTEGKTGNTRRNVNVGFLAFSAVSTKLALKTAKAKHARSTYRNGSSGTLDILALFGFVVIASLVVVLRGLMVYFQTKENARHSDELALTKSSIIRRLEPSIHRIYKYVGSKIDTLVEKEKDVLELTDDSSAKVGRSDPRLHRALATTRKELKAEIKNSTEDMRLSIQEAKKSSEDSWKDLEENISSIVAATVAKAMKNAEGRIAEAVMAKLDAMDKQEQESGMDSDGNFSMENRDQDVDESKMHDHLLL